jgi:hypothetical protein
MRGDIAAGKLNTLLSEVDKNVAEGKLLDPP